MKTMKILLLSTSYDHGELIEALRQALVKGGYDADIDQRSCSLDAINRLDLYNYNLVLFDLDHPMFMSKQEFTILHSAARGNPPVVILGLEQAVRDGANLIYPRCQELKINAARSDQPVGKQVELIFSHLFKTRTRHSTNGDLVKPQPVRKRRRHFIELLNHHDMGQMGRRTRPRAT